MNKIDTRRLEKVYAKVDSIAKKGKEGMIEYRGYIDQLIDDGQYYIVENLLERKYKIDSSKYTTVEIKSDVVYNLIRLQTTSRFQEELKKLYDDNNIYAMGINILSSITNLKLGEIIEVSNELIGETEKDTVIATKPDFSTLTIDDREITMIDKYKLAVEFLLN
jgi:hypothetical protein